MASRSYSTEEVVSMVYCSDEEEMDDPHEIVMEGSDEEFGGVEDLDEIENGTNA